MESVNKMKKEKKIREQLVKLFKLVEPILSQVGQLIKHFLYHSHRIKRNTYFLAWADITTGVEPSPHWLWGTWFTTKLQLKTKDSNTWRGFFSVWLRSKVGREWSEIYQAKWSWIKIDEKVLSNVKSFFCLILTLNLNTLSHSSANELAWLYRCSFHSYRA